VSNSFKLDENFPFPSKILQCERTFSADEAIQIFRHIIQVLKASPRFTGFLMVNTRVQFQGIQFGIYSEQNSTDVS
jgi:hypothetical protein